MSQLTSPISTIQKEALIQIIDKSNSIRDVLKHFGLDDGSYRTFYKRVKKDNISVEELKRKSNSHQASEISNEMAFTKNSSCSRHIIKKKIIKQHLLPYICRDCNSEGLWNGKKLSLQLEHINGVNDDNRLENLCFLCPNCHSQTETFAGKKKKREINNCEICGCVIGLSSTNCISCRNRLLNEKKKKFRITKERLENLVNKKMSFGKIGLLYGVSGNAIRKRCKTLGINYKRRGLSSNG